MKKIIIVLFLCFCGSLVFADDYYNLGKMAYENGRYGEAKEYLSIAVRNRPKNITYRYYYALSLSQLGLIEEAAEQYQTITMSSPNSNEGQKSARALESLKKYFETKAGDFKLPDPNSGDYFSYIILENTIIKRWDKNSINVFIPESNSKTIVEKAFLTWENKSDKLLTFNFVPTPDLADITVTFTDKGLFVSSEGGFMNSTINGSISIKYLDKNINKVSITIQDCDSKTKEEFSPDKIFATALHMAGHAIGLNTHSEDPIDIMYWELTDANKTISQSDINTLKKVYGISEENIKAIKENPSVFAIKLQKAKDYAQAYPNVPTAWSALAAAYVAVNDYENAVESIQKAIDLKPDDPALYTQIASFYAKLNKQNESVEAYKKAYDLQPNNKVYLYNWAKACYKNKRAQEARADVDSYLMGAGFLSNDEISRLLRRMYKQDKVKEKEKIKNDRAEKQRKIEEMEQKEQELFVD